MIRRGLSLLEVLAATALLGIAAAVCVPLLTRALDVMHRQSPAPMPLDHLTILADDVLADPESFGIEAAQLDAGESIDLWLPASGIGVSIQGVRPVDPAADHVLLVFSARQDGVRPVFRWRERRPTQEPLP